ncbi:Dockerin type I repeat-containing protein [Neorhodopirellula lusitana]|uniref:Dockerin type I repeat-containing protein n=2 Tax=Neorhodopirellula lusitana TaxID=445327 RepID=A0ABY1QI94_9BACT|nr:Dockerin type I repeat-containing protein [Neorhodopirellula lusitana]
MLYGESLFEVVDETPAEISTFSTGLSAAEGEETADSESAWLHAEVADDAAVFFDDSFVHEISITFENSDWYDVLYESHANDSDDPYFAADVTIDGVTMENVGIRFKGNSSFTGTGIKKSLKIDFDEFDEDNDSLTYLGLKKLNLNNNYNDPTMLREKLLYDFASNFVEGSSRAVHTNVTINGELYGIYTAVEQVDKTYVQTRFGSDEDGNLYKGAASDEAGDDPNADFGSDLTYLGDDPVAYEENYQLKTNETENDYSDLVEFIDVLNNTSAEDLAAAIEPLLDVDDTLASLAINNLFANLDSYNGSAHNYYLYDRDDSGQFTHILWDANESFGRFSLFTSPGEDLQELDPFWLPVATTVGGPGGGGPPIGGPGGTTTETDESRPLMENLWAVDEYSDDYLRDLAEMLREGFDITAATARINELADIIRDDVTADPNKQYTIAQFEQNLTTDIVSGQGVIYGLTSFIDNRATYLDAELDTYASSTDLRLNELMVLNVATVQDESGDFDPWIEIYNYGPGLVDVAGLYLTDDAGDLTKWSLPSESLDDGEFLTLWLDGETSAGTNHASFSLSATGGTLQLTDGVTVIDMVTYATMADDTSLARVPDGEGELETTDQPTFGTENLASVVIVEPVDTVELYINEFMADNDSVVEDPDEAGAYEDWVEIYNPGTEAIDLSGMSMTDDLTDPTQWQFASGTTIAAGGYLIVWADGDTDQGDDHATFKLSSGGEEIGLYHTDGITLIDSVTFGEQVTDVSYGRFPDGSETFVSMTTPTPSATNVNDTTTNVAPVADAGGPYSGLVDEAITLTADGSTDTDGTIVTYAWDLDNDGDYDDASGVTTSFTSTTAGTFTVGVQVTDDEGATSTESTTVSVLTATVTPVELYINEFMADNDATIEDPDEAGAFEDWVEIYNPGTEAIDLSGMSLTDDLTDPTQWQFASGTTIAAGGYLIVWADGDTDQGDDHATFKLSSGGEEIGLYHTDGITLIDSVTFGEQVTDVSYGRFPDGSESFVSMTTPTPSATNVNDTTTNVAPVADAGGPYSGLVDEAITLMADGSTDTDGTIATYAWDLDNDGDYDDATDVTTSFTSTTAGTFTVGVQVTDDEGATSTNFSTVTVSTVAVTPVNLLITEFMADNDTTIEDPDEAGAFEDWIEIYNPGTEAVDLSGMYLTDDFTDPTQWSFADGMSIAAGGYLLIWADGDTDQGDSHAAFKLSSSGEAIGLYNTDGATVIDSVEYGEQTTDVSYGRFPETSDTFVFLSDATPGAVNVNEVDTNVAPVADAGGPYTAQVGDTLTVSAAGSTDSDGSIVSYAWDLDDDGLYDDATGASTSFAATSVGTFTVSVQVTDDDGSTSIDTAEVTVSAVPATAGLVVVESSGSTSVSESGTSDTISVSLASQPTADVTIAISSNDTSEISVSASELTFTIANWDVAQLITVTGVAEGLVDGVQSTTISLDPSSSDTSYDSLADSSVTVTTFDTDTSTEVNARIYTPDTVVRPHVIPGDSVATAILFVAHATGTITVTPVGSASATETIRILDGDVQLISAFTSGIASAEVTAGGMYAILFDAQLSQRIYSVSSTAGSDAFTPTVTSNFLQPTDTNGDSLTTVVDALVVINQINDLPSSEGEQTSSNMLDVSRDGNVTALDALIVINRVNSMESAEAESVAETTLRLATTAPVASQSTTTLADTVTSEPNATLSDGELDTLISISAESDSFPTSSLFDEAVLEEFGDSREDVESDNELLLLSNDALNLDWVTG